MAPGRDINVDRLGEKRRCSGERNQLHPSPPPALPALRKGRSRNDRHSLPNVPPWLSGRMTGEACNTEGTMEDAWTARQGGVWWEDDGLRLIDQTLLPAAYRLLHPRTLDEVAEAIRRLAVRGAPAIGIAAAYGLVVALDEANPSREDEARRVLEEASQTLRGTRPTAVNLAWAVERVRRAVAERSHGSARALRDAVLAEARTIAEEDRELCLRMGRVGVEALGQARSILTHCNAGALATGGY